MNKNDLVNKVSDHTGLSKSASAKAVDAVFETILVENKIPQNLTQHLQRLKKGINQLKIKNFDIELLRKHIKKALSDQNNCYLFQTCYCLAS